MRDEVLSSFLEHHEQWLAGYALRVADSGGRAHDEPEHAYRSCYQRDRDRIVYCSAFRRLDYKTQVFVPHERDHFRTRLTHTLEVAQVARSLGRVLRANEDVIEAVALAHDLGHPPFGHAGEKVLDELMADHGHFEHNRQTLRVVDYLEHPYPHFRGLNLTLIVRRCLAKHQSRYDRPAGGAEFDDDLQAPLEGQLVDLADEIAYTAADLYDALAAEWITVEQLQELELWRRAWERARAEAPDARAVHLRIQACRNVLDILAEDVIAATRRRLERLQPTCPADIETAEHRVANFSDALAPAVGQLQAFLQENVYNHRQARQQDAKAARTIRELFSAYIARPELLPPRYQRRIDIDGLHRVVCDYIAGMTDRFCQLEHRRLTGR